MAEIIDIEVRDEEAKKKLDETSKGLLNIGESATEGGGKLDAALKRVLNNIINQKAKVKDLENTYKTLKKAQGAAFMSGDDAQANKLKEQSEVAFKNYKNAKIELSSLREEQKRYRAEAEQVSKANEKNVQSTASLKMQLLNLRNATATLELEYRKLSEAEKNSAKGQQLQAKIRQMTNDAAMLSDTLGDVNSSIKNMASDTSTFDAISQGLNVAASAAGAYVGVLGMLGASEEEQQAIQTKLQASLAISNALSVVQNALQKQSALMLGVQAIQAKAAATAIAIKTAAEGKGVIATKAATIAQAAFNAVAKANPYVLLATALLTVVGAITAFALGTKKAADAEKEMADNAEREAEAQKNLKNYYGSLFSGLGSLVVKYNALSASYRQMRSDAEKTQWLKENKSAMDELGISIKNVNDADAAFIANSKLMMRTFQLRTQVAALQKLAEAAVEEAEGQRLIDANKDKNQLSNGTYNLYDVQANVYSDKYMQALEQLRKLEKELGVFKKYESGADTGDKAEALNKEIARMAYNARIGAKDAEIKAMQDGEEKLLAQMELDHQKEIDEVEKQKNDYIAKKKELAKLQGKQYDAGKDPALVNFDNTLKHMNDAYEASVGKVKSATKTAINEFLAENGTYTDKVVAIMALYEEKMKGANNAEKMQLANEMQERLSSARSAYGDNLQDVSDEGLTSLLGSLKQLININKDAFNTKQLEAYRDEIAAIENEIANRKPVTSLRKAEEEYDTATSDRQKAERNMFTANDDVAKAQKALNQAENGTYKDDETKIKAVTAAQNTLNQAKAKAITASKNYQNACQREIDAEQKVKRAKEQTLASIGKLVQAIGQVGSVVGGTVGEITSIVETIGMTVVSSIAGMDTAAQAGSEAIKTVERASVILAIISAAIQVAQQIASLLNNDDDKEENIKNYQRQINALQNAYKDLEKQVEKTYSSEKQANIELEIQNKQKQISLIYRQIDEERDKKDSDGDKIASWQQNILDLQREIKDLKEAAKDAIFGEDINTAIENFADAYASAWEQGISRVKSVKDVVRNSMKQMVKLSIESAIQASGSMEKIRTALAGYFADGILDAFEQNAVEQMAVKLEREIENKFGWANNLLKSKSSTEGTSGGFATMSQDSADELNGRFTALQMSANSIDVAIRQVNELSRAKLEHVVTMRGHTEEMVNLSLEAVDYLGRIEKNTAQLYEVNTRLEAIERKL